MVRRYSALAAALLGMSLLLAACGTAETPAEAAGTAAAVTTAPITIAATEPPEPYSRAGIAAANLVVNRDFADTIQFVRDYLAYTYPDFEADCQWEDGYWAPGAMFDSEYYRDTLSGGVFNYTATLTRAGETRTVPVQITFFEKGRWQYLSAVLEGEAITTTRPEGYALLRQDGRFVHRMRDFGILALPEGTESREVDGDREVLADEPVSLDMGDHGTVFERDNDICLLQNGRETVLLKGDYDEVDELELRIPRLYRDYGKIDENRFVFYDGGWEWVWGIGVYDLSTKSVVYHSENNPETKDLGLYYQDESTLWLGDLWQSDTFQVVDLSDYSVRPLTLERPEGYSVWDACFSKDGSRIAALCSEGGGGNDNALGLWDSRDGALAASYPIEVRAGYQQGIGFEGNRPWLRFYHYADDTEWVHIFPEIELN